MAPSRGAEFNARWWPAPAKLNLFLHVTSRRPDGLHELQTLFQLLDWGDEVFVCVTEGDEITRTGANYDIPPEQDLAIRAARRLKARTGVRGGAGIEVRKSVPQGAGMGGGSSDAATVLVVLNQLWNCGLTVDELAGLALELGADVPLFVRGHSALATGVGEQLESVALGERHYLVVVPDLAISTADVFADPDLERDTPLIDPGDALAGGGRNDCEAVVRRRYPGMARLIDALGAYGDARMSGTGSAVFVPMASRAMAVEAAEKVKTGAAREFNCRYNVRAVAGLDRSPLLQALNSRTPG